MYGPGIGPEPLDFSTPESDEAIALADAFITLGGTGAPPNWADYEQFSLNLQVVFHDGLTLMAADVTAAIMTEIDSKYSCTDALNPEIKQRWYPLGIMSSYAPVMTPS